MGWALCGLHQWVADVQGHLVVKAANDAWHMAAAGGV
jgi:hypothetical protein